jgi:CheY-like chemotaxis protein/DNA-directed RNA polymerase subunit RPC12/RpoP
MVVRCSRCGKGLKIDEEKLIVRNVLFQCPKCKNIFVPERPVVLQNKMAGNGKILIAHSNPSLVSEMTTILKKNGYHSVASSDGIDAIIKAVKEHPSLAIIEVDLPKINGPEVCRRLRLTNKTKGIEFLFVVSSNSERSMEFLSQWGPNNYIEDFRIPELLIEKIDLLKQKD